MSRILVDGRNPRGGMMGIKETKGQSPILGLIGNTPLIEISQLTRGNNNVRTFAKAEWMNPGGSLKDRPVKRILEQAMATGAIDANKTVLDSSSGNAGIAYAMIGAALGLKVAIVVPGNASQERKQRIVAHGAELIETDPLEGYDEALRHAHRLAKAEPERFWLANQYANEHNWRSHFDGTGAEIIEQVEGTITHFVGGVGTGGSITGIGRRLKRQFPDIQVIAVRPEFWPGIEGLKPMGSPEDIVPAILDEAVIDRWVDVTADEARYWCHRAAGTGLFIGQSSGAYLAVCNQISSEIIKGRIVTLFNDFGDRYFSAGLWKS